MSSDHIPFSESEWNKLTHIVTKYYNYIISHVSTIDTSTRSIVDPHVRYGAALEHLRHGMSSDRLIFRCLKYLNAHHGIIKRKAAYTLKAKDFEYMAMSIDDLIVAFGEIGLIEQSQEMIKFYQAYVGLFQQAGIDLIVTKPSNLAPPKYKTIKWYLDQGWEPYFENKRVRFLKGDKAYEECLIVAFEDEKSVCEYSGEQVVVTNDIPLSWD